MAVPFVFELRTLMDWIWTDTSMTLMDWLKMEDIFASVFLLKVLKYKYIILFNKYVHSITLICIYIKRKQNLWELLKFFVIWFCLIFHYYCFVSVCFYFFKCSRYVEDEFPQPRGVKKSSTSKYMLGGGVLAFVIAIIWFPLVFFAFGNSVSKCTFF